MNSITEIKTAISNLPVDDVYLFRSWFEDFVNKDCSKIINYDNYQENLFI